MRTYRFGQAKRAVTVTYDPRKQIWVLVGDFRITINRGHHAHHLKIPDGYEFDLASIPRCLWSLIAPFELSLVAPLVHDVLYQYAGRLPAGWLDPQAEFSRRDADNLFLELMTLEGIVWWKRVAAYRAVRFFSSIFWDRNSATVRIDPAKINAVDIQKLPGFGGELRGSSGLLG